MDSVAPDPVARSVIFSMPMIYTKEKLSKRPTRIKRFSHFIMNSPLTKIVRFGEKYFVNPNAYGSNVEIDHSSNSVSIGSLSDVVDISEHLLMPPEESIIKSIVVEKKFIGAKITLIWNRPNTMVTIMNGHGINTITGLPIMFEDRGAMQLVYDGSSWHQF